jgi:hypothetical protein
MIFAPSVFKAILDSYAQASPAGLFAAAAGGGALAAVLHVGTMLLTLVAAGLADFSALAQQVLGMLGAPGHEAGRQGADVGAVAVEADTADHHFNVFFLKAGRGAVFARGDAGIEGVEQGLILGMHWEGN